MSTSPAPGLPTGASGPSDDVTASARSSASARPRVGVLDYGSGNLHSACRALAEAGAAVELSSDAARLAGCDALVVPGVGAFAACMDGLLAVGGDRIVYDWLDTGRPLLAICVGHQVLFDKGVEFGHDAAGLGVLPGTVERLDAERLPHMGWNTVEVPEGSEAFAGVERERFYFVHSFGVHTEIPDARVTWVDHGGDRFVAAVERGPVWSTQFHPEKSGDAGATLLRSFVDRARTAGS